MLTFLSMAGYAWIGLQFLIPGEGFTVCLFRNVTGLPCPSCGVTRSLLLIIGGDLQQALLVNPLGPVAAIALAGVPLWILKDFVTRKSTLSPLFLRIEKKIKTKKTIYMPLIALALLNWGWNILKEL